MKVLERGEGWKLNIRCTGSGNGCGGCGSLLEIREEDIYYTYNYDYAGDRDTYYTVICPVCGKETDIPHDKIPSSLSISGNNKERVLQRYRREKIC